MPEATPRRERNLSTYAMAAGAAAVAGTTAHADVQYTLLNQNVVLDDPDFELDMDGDSNTDLFFDNRSIGLYNGSWQVVQTPNTQLMTNEVYTVPGLGDYSYATPQASGDLIDGSGFYSYFTNLTYGGLGPAASDLDAGPILLGFSMEVASNTHFGWVRLEVDADNAVYTVIDAAYEDTPGLAIEAGSLVSIPEPSSLGLLAAGALGLSLYRGRRES